MYCQLMDCSSVQQVEEMKKEVDVYMCFYLTEEQNGKEKNTLFVLSHEEIMLLERRIEEYRGEGVQQARVIKELSAARDKAARQVGVQVRAKGPSAKGRVPRSLREQLSCTHGHI